MFKKITAISLAAISLVSTFSVAASAASENTATMQAIGIIDSGDSLTAQLTRADFAEMLVNASIYADNVGTGYGYSLYTDVKSDHAQSAYIKVAVENGWMTGYIDGSFRPDQTMKLEEAVSAIIKLLGYSSTDLIGAYPYAQLSKASALGLLDGIAVSQGQTITTGDAVDLLYNAMLAQTQDAKVYGTVLGYTITGDDIDYSSLVNEGTKGPFVTYNGQVYAPFSLDNATIYVNGEQSDVSSIDAYDVYYYHTDMNSVWVYDDKITGTITSLSPSAVAPTAVTVAGQSYNIGTSNATHQLSSQGEFKVGDTVTLLLGMDGSVVEAASVADINYEYYGMVISSETSLSATGGTSQISTKIACTDGTERTFLHDGSSYDNGDLVSVKISDGGLKVSKLSSSSLSGTMNSDGTKIGSYELASDVQILDIDDDGNFAKIYTSSLIGMKIDSSDVSFYQTNENDEVTHIILDNTTGDTYTYGYLISEETKGSDMSTSAVYEILLNGQVQTLNSTSIYSADVGGVSFTLDSTGKVDGMKSLKEADIDEVSGNIAYDGSKKYTIAENVQVILEDGYIVTNLSDINIDDYELTGYYDSSSSKIRVIIAE